MFGYHEVTVREITVVERARSGQGGSEELGSSRLHQIFVQCLVSSDVIIPDKLGR